MRRGLAESLDEAGVLIDQGRVRVSGSIARKPNHQVAPFEPLVVEAPPRRYVSRAGFKLQGALEAFGIDPRGRRILDAGASTGGFTDCLLAGGAGAVVAVDVGTNQLHERLRTDQRVDARERTDIRSITRSDLPDDLDLITADLSFISVATLIPTLVTLAGRHGELVILVKPQFEATRAEADRGAGVITDPVIWRRTIEEVMDALEAAGAGIMGVMQSELRGAAGNTEFFVHARCGTAGLSGDDRRIALDRAISGER